MKQQKSCLVTEIACFRVASVLFNKLDVVIITELGVVPV